VKLAEPVIKALCDAYAQCRVRLQASVHMQLLLQLPDVMSLLDGKPWH
jgi:hypothetical protein